jgi:putative ABC transport system permease protein
LESAPPGRSYSVDPEYFRTLGITAVQGELLDASSPPDAFVIDEALAQRYWPDGNAVGSRFTMPGIGISGITDFLVVGVSRHLRADRIATPTSDEVFVIYKKIPPDAPVVSRFVAKLDDERRLESLKALVRAMTERAIVRVDTGEARYAKLDGDTRLAAAITTGFGSMALLVATCGIYAMMAFLVAGRSREIGIRMALGADRTDVRRMIFSSSLRFVAAGGVIGLGAAVLASRLIASQLFGVTPTDPLTYAAVAALVMTTGMAATWWPARRASRIDPAITLRSE